MNSCAPSQHLNHHSSALQNPPHRKKNFNPVDSYQDSGLSDFEDSEFEKQWGEIEECPKHDGFELEPDLLILKEVLNIEKENVTNTLELLNSSRTISCSVPQDPITKHTAQLHKFAEEITIRINQISDIVEKAKAGKLLDSPKVLGPVDFPPFPKNFPITRKLRDKIVELCSESPSISPNAILVTDGENTATKPEIHKQVKEPVLLTKESHRKLLVRSVAFLLHSAGYASVDSETLDVLVSAVDNFFEDILATLRRNVDSRAFSDDGKNLQHSLDKILRETGFGGIKGLLTFYQEHIIDKHQDALENCVKLYRKFSSNMHILEELQSDNADKIDLLQTHFSLEDSPSKLKQRKTQNISTLKSSDPSKKCSRKKSKEESSLSRKKKKKVPKK